MNIRPLCFIDRSLLEAGFFWKFKSRLVRLSDNVSSIPLRSDFNDEPVLSEWKAASSVLNRIASGCAILFGGRGAALVSSADLMVVDIGGIIPWGSTNDESSDDTLNVVLGVSPSPGGMFYSGHEARNVPVGELCYINDKVLHSVVNHGECPMIYLNCLVCGK